MDRDDAIALVVGIISAVAAFGVVVWLCDVATRDLKTLFNDMFKGL